MDKIVYKLHPGDYQRIGEHESWLADMAAEGLFLEKMGIHFAKFVKGEPRKMRYRIDFNQTPKFSGEKIQLYAENGWDYVTSYRQFHVFSSPEELDAPELYTDPAEQQHSLKELDKKLRFNAAATIVGMILMIGMMAAIWFLNATPTFVIMEGTALQQTIFTVFIGYTAYNSLKATLSIRELRKRLAEGREIDHKTPWKKHHRVRTAAAFLFTVIVGLSAVIPFVQLMKMETKTLPKGNADLPIVRLADVENNPDLVRADPSYMSDNVDWGNRYSYDWSPFAPVQYESDETGIVPGKWWNDGSGEYSPTISTQYYQLTFPTMADDLISDLMKRYRYKNTPDEYVEQKHPVLDDLIVLEEKDRKEVFASKGNKVIYVRYHGYAELDSVIENVVKKIR